MTRPSHRVASTDRGDDRIDPGSRAPGLDRDPDAAASWVWQASEQAWSVNTGAETVKLPHGHVTGVAQLACTCLLSPLCFHVLACLTRLEVTVVESRPAEPPDGVEPATADDSDDVVEPDEKQQHAARELVKNVAQLLQVGVASAGWSCSPACFVRFINAGPTDCIGWPGWD